MYAPSLIVPTPARDPLLYDLVVSSGGSRAILGGAGAILAAHHAGIRQWNSIGGVSGGSIPALLLSTGVSAPDLVRLALDYNFRNFITRTPGLFRSLWTLLWKEYYERTFPSTPTGIYSTENLGNYADEIAPTWPEKFWTAAVIRGSLILFTARGVFEYNAEGIRLLSDKPPPVGLAIRATCTIPGIIRAVKYQDRYLFDGALGSDGMCPVTIPMRHFAADPERIVACCLGEEFTEGWQGFFFRLWKFVWNTPNPPCWPAEAQSVIAFRPRISHIHALRFNLSPDEKWLAISLGATAALRKLFVRGVIPNEHAEPCLALLQALEPVTQLIISRRNAGRIAGGAQAVLHKHGLWS